MAVVMWCDGSTGDQTFVDIAETVEVALPVPKN
jgi:hypothetical protein